MARVTLDKTMDRLLLLIRAGYPVIYVVSHEESRVLDYLAKIVRIIRQENPSKGLFRWYEGMGLERLKNLGTAASTPAVASDWLKVEGLPPRPEWDARRADGATALNSIKGATPTSDPALAESVTVFFDLHPKLTSGALTGTGPLVRPLRNTADALRRYYDLNRRTEGRPYKTIVVVAPSAAALSMELERDLIVLDFPLAETPELVQIIEEMVSTGLLDFPDGIVTPEARKQLCEHIAGAGRGLTLEDYKRGLNMFAVSNRRLQEEHIRHMLDLKAKAINSQALQYTPHVTIDLGGLAAVKKWIQGRREPAVSDSVREKYRLPAPKGVMLCGVSGGGKSQLAKLIAKEFSLALLRLDVGALFGSYVGESEERTRKALEMAEVLAPVVLWIDEIDKAFTGMGGGGDNGVSARVFGHFLTWLAEKQDSVFVVTTANDFTSLLDRFPEFGRKGRFDEIFWVGLPNTESRQKIFEIYLKPHTDHLLVHREQVEELRQASYVAEPLPEGLNDLESFCWLLSRPGISAAMTGAEIEYAIVEGLYKAYELDREQPNNGTFTAELLLETVSGIKGRALYRPGTDEATRLQQLETAAQDKHWLFVGEPGDGQAVAEPQ
jgi:ATPase family protein associated with various cellular activities (AAA)